MDAKCPHCGVEYIAAEREYGKFVKCETCGKGFIVGVSAMEKMGEGVQTIMDAAKMATRTAYEKVREVDWKKQGEFAKSVVGKAGGVVANSIRRQSGETGMKHMTRLAIVGIGLIFATQCICPILFHLILEYYGLSVIFKIAIVQSIISSVGWVMILMFFIALYRRQKT